METDVLALDVLPADAEINVLMLAATGNCCQGGTCGISTGQAG